PLRPELARSCLALYHEGQSLIFIACLPGASAHSRHVGVPQWASLQSACEHIHRRGRSMNTVPLDLAFSRFGASVSAGQRQLCATAQDGSLVLVCLSSGFSRPGPAVLRYSAKLSLIGAGGSQIEALRLGLDAAFSGRTAVRLIVRTASVDGLPAAVHMRADLVGS